MQVKIERFDHQAKGIALVDNKVTFVPKTIPGDIVEVKITKEGKSFNQASLVKVIESSPLRVASFCPFYAKCGGCDLQNLSYEETLKYKVEKVKNIFARIKMDVNPEVISNPHPLHYRNKIELKIRNGQLGFYEKETNTIVAINECLITDEAINEIIPLINNLKLQEASVTIRCNQNHECLVIFATKEKLNYQDLITNKNIKGIILNNKKIYGIDFLEEQINDLKYHITYDAFFQVNPYVAALLFKKVKENILDDACVLDLYSGVGTLALTVASKVKKVLGIEIIENAVLNACQNQKLNNLTNVTFKCGDVEKIITSITDNYDTFIVDPPRKGLDNKTITVMLEKKPKTIIYVSCDAQTLVRDIAKLKEKYDLKKLYLFDMFSYTYHVESLCVLSLR